MTADYTKKLFDQLEDALAMIDSMKEEIKGLKADIRSIKWNHEMDLSALRAEHRKEISETSARHEEEKEKLSARIKVLEAENAKLKGQLGKDSSNSGKPPSTDGFKKITHTREKSGRGPGGQKGHPGKVPILFEHPDEVTDLNRKECDCGGLIIYEGGPVRKQVLDIKVSVNVHEYQARAGVCDRCGKKIKNAFPVGVKNPVNIGPSVKAMAALLTNEGAVSLMRTKQIISELTGGVVNLSDGSISNFTKELSQKLDATVEEIKRKIIASHVNHKDETGVGVNGKQHWLHVLSNKSATLYAVSEKRGGDADKDMGVLESYADILVHDHFKPLYAFSCIHAECNQHVLRYLKGVVENEKLYTLYAEELASLLRKANNERNDLIGQGLSAFPSGRAERYRKRYEAILTKWNKITIAAEAERKRKKKSGKYKPEAEALGKRLYKYREQHLLFLTDFSVPFTNNLGESDLRMVKSKLKVSGCFRSKEGADNYARVRSYISTLRKNRLNIYAGLLGAFSGEAGPIFAA